jgi:hypothetical protein
MDETFVVGSGLLAPTMNMYFAMGDSGQVVTSAFVSHVIAKVVPHPVSKFEIMQMCEHE